MGKCVICGKKSPFISEVLSFCLSCLRKKPEEALELAREAHRRSRKRWNLPGDTPRSGKRCHVCVNECELEKGGIGLCGVRYSGDKGITKLSGSNAYLSYYYDPIPTNCVAEWVCGEKGPGYNLAVFFGGCTFDCLFCQNWHHRELVGSNLYVKTPMDLAEAVRNDTKCICYFGGDPTPYIDFVYNASKRIIEKKMVRICIETNGSMNWRLLEPIVDISSHTSGTIKFDLKAWSEDLHIALTGSSNKNTISNIAYAFSKSLELGNKPIIVVSTLLVPGYIDREEIFNIAKYLSSLDPAIPYSLLAFYPQYMMGDLPPTPRALADECYKTAKDAGLKNIKIGNVHLLW